MKLVLVVVLLTSCVHHELTACSRACELNGMKIYEAERRRCECHGSNISNNNLKR